MKNLNNNQEQDISLIVGLDNKPIRSDQPAAPSVISGTPFDMDPATFAAALEVRKQNRKSLMAWLREAMIEGLDYGRIHVMNKTKCPDGARCKNMAHWSRHSLFKSGAEKIIGYLGLRATWPNLDKYEEHFYAGGTLDAIFLRCEIIDGAGNIVGTGSGARSLETDKGDLNKAVKMAKKSSMIDACISTSGLSEVYTQDLEDTGLGEQQKDAAPIDEYRITWGKYGKDGDETKPEDIALGSLMADIDTGYLAWISENGKSAIEREYALVIVKQRKTDESNGNKNITSEQKKTIKMLVRAKMPDRVQDAKDFIKNATYAQAVKKIADLIRYDNSKNIADGDSVISLLDLCANKLGIAPLKTIERVNAHIKKRFNVATVEMLTVGQLDAVYTDVANGKGLK